MAPRANAEVTGQPAWVLSRCHRDTLQPGTALCSLCAAAFKVGSNLCLIQRMALAEFVQLLSWRQLMSLGDSPEVESCQCLCACAYKHLGFNWCFLGSYTSGAL